MNVTRIMRRFIIIILALGLAVARSHAASGAEMRAYKNAAEAFHASIWDRAEKEFGNFVAKYPDSTNVPEAVLLQAQAWVQMTNLPAARVLLESRQASAGDLADEYLFWTAQIYFQEADYLAAAKTFATLASQYPQSNHRLDATLGEAAADAQLAQWGRVVELLSDPRGAFQRASDAGITNEVIFRGGLLLARAQLAQKNFGAAEEVLTNLADWHVSRPLQWQRLYSLSQAQLADEQPQDALRSAEGLYPLADSPELRAQSVETRATILHSLDRFDDAISAYRQNLAANVPLAHQQQALFRIAEISLALGRVDDTSQQLQTFLNQNTNSPVADVVWFTLGDMQLKQYIAGLSTNRAPDAATNSAAGMNYLLNAMFKFQQLTNKFPFSPLIGKALLDEGWCYWFNNNWSNSAAAFQAAAYRLPFSEDQLIARFKWADAQTRLKDYKGAKTNYDFVATHALASSVPAMHDLAEPALYQLLGASFDAADANSGERALGILQKEYPDSFIAPRALLRAGEGYSLQLQPDPARARDKFLEVEQRYPNSPYLPETRLAIARTYEQEGLWTNAIAQYDDWLATFTNNPAKPRVEYYRGWANFQAGYETNALTLFTNFVARFPTDPLAPSARWWIADHYFRDGDYVNAEKNYQILRQDYPGNELAYQATMNAGRAAMARRPPDAVYYFTNLTSDVNCPQSVFSEALFAWGDEQMMVDATGTNKQENLKHAIRLFIQISPTNSLYTLAVGRIGDCYLQLAVWNPAYYEQASNAYAQVVAAPQADVATRSQAKVGLGVVAEKQAQQKSAGDQTSLLAVAFNDYNDVFFGTILNTAREKPDPYWTKKAGMEAARVAEQLGYWVQAVKIYQRLELLAPPLQPMLEKKIAAAKKNLEGTPE